MIYAPFIRFRPVMIIIMIQNRCDSHSTITIIKMLFRNFKESENKILTYELGYPIKPHKSRVCETYIQFKYASEELDTIIQEIDEREFLLGKVTEVWASEPSFNPFSEIISFFRKRQNTEYVVSPIKKGISLVRIPSNRVASTRLIHLIYELRFTKL